MHTSPVRLALAGILVLALGGCQPAAAPPAAPLQAASAPAVAGVRPCALLDRVAAQAVLAQSVEPMNDDAENCMWRSADSPMAFTTLMLTLVNNDDDAMAAQVYEGVSGIGSKLGKLVNQPLGQTTRKTVRVVDGLGDEAVFLASNQGEMVQSSQFVVRKGRRVAAFVMTGMGEAEGAVARLELAARRAVEGM
ncbi:hypothetical protein ASD88_18935 [Pelomonas sp. Root662]|nr:hypothetical protein ASC81_14775 [Pelomonas sp. Root405]KRA70188.1 hypothetical protein ASD88_18935 [Pelomonas sp. Root662]